MEKQEPAWGCGFFDKRLVKACYAPKLKNPLINND